MLNLHNLNYRLEKIKKIATSIQIVFKLFILTLSLIVVLLPSSAQAEGTNTLQSDKQKMVEKKKLTQKELEVLLGPEPYLGPTSWLNSQEES